MSNKVSKYNGSTAHRIAILHMIGQSVDVFNSRVRISEIAAWMNVSKVTARKHIQTMIDRDEIITSKVPYKNTCMVLIELHPDMKVEYEAGKYKEAYQMYAQRVMKVILQ